LENFFDEDFKVFGKDVGGTERKEAKIRNILTINQIKGIFFFKKIPVANLFFES